MRFNTGSVFSSVQLSAAGASKPDKDNTCKTTSTHFHARDIHTKITLDHGQDFALYLCKFRALINTELCHFLVIFCAAYPNNRHVHHHKLTTHAPRFSREQFRNRLWFFPGGTLWVTFNKMTFYSYKFVTICCILKNSK